jgi:hypothetical protein
MVSVYIMQPGSLVLTLFSRSWLRDSRGRRHALALIAILAIGLWFRVYRFKELPYGLWYDEADNGLWARQILTDPTFRPIYVSSTNLPAHFLYLVALAFRLFGDSMHSIRAVAVLFGMGTIVAAYHCGCELGAGAASTRSAIGPKTESHSGAYLGLVLAFLLAVSRWDVNWSRIGMHGVTVPFFELWIVAALLRGLRTRRLVAFGWAGVALGLGLCFYSPLRIFPVVLAGFLLAWGGRWLVQAHLYRSWDLSRRLVDMAARFGIPAILFVLGALIAVAPVAQYARREPDLFWDRAKKISILEDPQASADPVRTLLDSTAKHLLMFHYRGDPNGRHNLPGAPMLDRLSGVLMVFGIVMCLSRLRDPRSILLLLWLLIPLSGGILSTWFEAPQSLRSIGSLPAVYALACLPMAWFAGEWKRVFERRSHGRDIRLGARPARMRTWNGRLAFLALVVLGSICLENGFTYFYLWGRDFSSWAAFSAAETRLAQDVNRYRQGYDLLFDPLLTAHLATRYLVPDYEVYHHFDPGTVFPLRGTDREGVVLFIAPDTYPVRDQAKALYPCRAEPCMRAETFAHPYSGNVVLYKYLFPREAIAGVQGLDARYVSLAATGTLGSIEQRVDPVIDFSWSAAQEGERLDASASKAVQAPKEYPFEATWTGGLLAPEYGVYDLRVELPGWFVLELDGQEVLSGVGLASRRIVLAQGVHDLYLDGQVREAGAVRLMWQTPTALRQGDASRTVPGDALYRASWPVRGLVGRYYANDQWAGEPTMVRLDRQLAYYFHFLPLPRPYTVEWRGRLAVPVEGVYRLRTKAISSASLYLDGRPVIDRSSPGQADGSSPDTPGPIAEGEVYLTAGLHDLRVRYLDDQSHSQIYLYWQPPEGEQVPIPPDALILPDENSAAEGAWWPVPENVEE